MGPRPLKKLDMIAGLFRGDLSRGGLSSFVLSGKFPVLLGSSLLKVDLTLRPEPSVGDRLLGKPAGDNVPSALLVSGVSVIGNGDSCIGPALRGGLELCVGYIRI
jgi:hypothetical protein